MVTKIKIDPEQLALLCATAADDRKAENIITLKVAELSSIADYFVLCTANSEPHLKAVADKIEKNVKETLGVYPKSDGTPGSQWILLDYGCVIVHVLTPESRDRYRLESLWGDAPVIEAVKTIEKLSRKKTE